MDRSKAKDLFDCVKEGDLDYIKSVKADVLLNARNEEGISILSVAIKNNNFECCKEILKKCPSLLYIQETSIHNFTVLHYAIYNNNYMMVDYFLGVGLDAATNEGNMVRFMKWIKLKDYFEETALIKATKEKSLHAVKRLIELDREYKLGLSEIVDGWYNQTALQLAVENQDHEIIKLLTDDGEGDPYSDYIPYSIAMDLFDHIKNGDLDYVKTVTEDVLLKSRDERGYSALSVATQYNQLGCCEEILKRCPTLLYHETTAQNSVLHHATNSGGGYYRLVDLFLGVALDAFEGNVESKAENMQRFKNWINLQNFSDSTALIEAVRNRNHDIVKRFLEVDRQYKLGLSDIPDWIKKTPLQLALENKDQKMIKLLKEGTDLDLEHGANTGGNMSLLIATSQTKDLFDCVKEGDLDYIKSVKADLLLNARNKQGISILSAAIRNNNFDCCKEILKKCPSLLYIQETSFCNYTVLHYAILYNYYRMVDNYTVLHCAIGNDNYMMVDYFLGVGLDAATNEGNMVRFMEWIQLKNHMGETALIQATKENNLHAVKRLIELDREYKLGLSEIVNHYRQTPLQLAVENQDHEIIKLLTDEGDPYSDYIPYSIAMDLFDHIKNGNLDYVKTVRSDVLLKSRDDKFRESAISIATKYNQLGCCEEILKRCPTLLYHQTANKGSVLHFATEVGYFRLVDFFVGVGLDAATIDGNVESKAENMQRFKNWINLQNIYHETALTLAVEYRNHDIVKRFLEVDRQYKLGLTEIPAGWKEKTPLQLALEDEDQEMIKLLTDGTDLDLEHGANTDSNMSLLIATSQTKESLHTGNNSDSAGTNPEFEYGANTNPDENMSLSIASTQTQEALHTGNYSNSVGPDPDFKYGATTDGKMSLSIAATQAQEALHTANNSDSAGMDASNDFEKVHLTSIATDRMEDSYVGEFNKNSSTDSVTKFLSDLESEKPQKYSLAQLMNFTNKFSDPVGSGGFGKVYKGEFPNGVLIAVKVLKNSRSALMVKQFKAEVSTMGRTYHRNLIKLYGYCYEADTAALIYEYMEKGDLDAILKKNHFDMVKLYTIATEIARGISYLHESCYPQIIHHDLKPANVLLDSKFSPRIIDFGLARLNMDKSQFAQSRLRGTYGYVAPEIALPGSGTTSCKCDVYSFGMILFDILKSKINYVHQRWLPGQVWGKVKEGELAKFLKDHVIKEDDNTHAKTLSMVALVCAEYKPQNRPSMSDVVKMLEGRMTPNPPIDPFPFYDSSSDSSTYDLSY